MRPVIVLVRPQLGENIGKAARAMLNFGLTDLRLVAPRDGWPNPDAGPSASGADSVLDEAKVTETLNEAVADCNQVFATTVRPRGMLKDVITPREAVEKTNALAAQGGRTAYVFGPERSGLDNDDIAQSDAIVTAPVNPDFGSLNLAQAVILLSYEYFQSSYDAPDVAPGLYEGPASKAELEGLYQQFHAQLAERAYFHPEERAPTLARTLRNMLERAGFSSQEVRTLRGILKHLTRKAEEQ